MDLIDIATGGAVISGAIAIDYAEKTWDNPKTRDYLKDIGRSTYQNGINVLRGAGEITRGVLEGTLFAATAISKTYDSDDDRNASFLYKMGTSIFPAVSLLAVMCYPFFMESADLTQNILMGGHMATYFLSIAYETHRHESQKENTKSPETLEGG